MSIVGLTPSLTTCERLAHAGFPQETVCAWTRPVHASYAPGVTMRDATPLEAREVFAAPVLSEVLAHLPALLGIAVPHPVYGSVERAHTLDMQFGERTVIGYRLVGKHEVEHRVESDRPVEAAAQLYLDLWAAGLLGAPGTAPETDASEAHPMARAA